MRLQSTVDDELNVDEEKAALIHVCSLSRQNGYANESKLRFGFVKGLGVLLHSLSGLFPVSTLVYTSIFFRRHARAINPVRERFSYLLCTIVLGNVLANSTLTILLDDLGENAIVLQAICSRHGMAIGAHTVWITRIFMLPTLPLPISHASYPISWMLDEILDEEIDAYYNERNIRNHS